MRHMRALHFVLQLFTIAQNSVYVTDFEQET